MKTSGIIKRVHGCGATTKGEVKSEQKGRPPVHIPQPREPHSALVEENIDRVVTLAQLSTMCLVWIELLQTEGEQIISVRVCSVRDIGGEQMVFSIFQVHDKCPSSSNIQQIPVKQSPSCVVDKSALATQLTHVYLRLSVVVAVSV